VALVMHEHSFKLFHIGDVHSHTDSGFMKPTKITTYTRYTEHKCSISPKDAGYRRNKGVTRVFCPSCGKDVEVVTTDNTFAKYPKELLSSDRELRGKILSIILGHWARFVFKVLAVTAAFLFVMFLVRGLIGGPSSFLGEAFGFALVMSAFVVIFLIISLVYSISLVVNIRRGVILGLGSAPISLIQKVSVKSPHQLHRVVTQMDLKNPYGHKVSYIDKWFADGSSNLSWRVGEKIFGEGDHCYIDTDFNNIVREAE